MNDSDEVEITEVWCKCGTKIASDGPFGSWAMKDHDCKETKGKK